MIKDIMNSQVIQKSSNQINNQNMQNSDFMAS